VKKKKWGGKKKKKEEIAEAARQKKRRKKRGRSVGPSRTMAAWGSMAEGSVRRVGITQRE